MIRSATLKDSQAICDIYNYYILNSHCTFEYEPITASTIQDRIETVQNASLEWVVLEMEEKILGYAYATKWKPRQAYARTVESTVYLDKDAGGNGYGFELYSALIESLKSKKIHAVLGGIALPNESSIALHEKLGYQKVAQLKEVGYKFNRWIDVGYWELILDDA